MLFNNVIHDYVGQKINICDLCFSKIFNANLNPQRLNGGTYQCY